MRVKLIKNLLITLIPMLIGLFLLNFSNFASNQIRAEEITGQQSLYILTVNKTGLGTIISNPAGINCGSDCSESYPEGTKVTLTAMADDGWVVTEMRFENAEDSENMSCLLKLLTPSPEHNISVSCTITLNRPINAYITFTRAGVIKVTKIGSGTIISSPTGISCGCDCSEAFFGDTRTVTLTANPAIGATFIGWEGDCTGTDICTLDTSHHRNITAKFTQGGKFPLTISKTGSGTITSSPAGINCGSDCSELYDEGTQVTLTIKGDSGWVIDNMDFSGSCNQRAKGEWLLTRLTLTPPPVVYSLPLEILEPETITIKFSPITGEKPPKWSFAIITDLHIGRGYPDYDGTSYEDGEDGQDYYLTERLDKVVNWVNENKNKIDCGEAKCPIKFLAVLGDTADTAEKSEFQKARQILDKLNDPNRDGNTSDGIPYLPVFGNHDVWPYTDDEEADYSQGEQFFDEIFWNENATNTKLLIERLNFQRDDANPKYKNFAFSYKGISFIVLDFNSRTHVPSLGLKTGVWPEANNWDETTNWLKDCLIDHKECLKGYEENSNIIFSHHPFVERSSDAFNSNEINEIEEIIENGNILANFGGHIHGAYPFLLPWFGEHFMDANKEYPPIGTTSIITTEALMVGSNENNEYLKEHDKGVIRIVRVFSKNSIDHKTRAGKYNPETEEGKEFIALNPYISWAYKFLEGSSNPCIFFKSHPFTNREISSYDWEFGDGKTGNGKIIPLYCYSNPGIYNVTSTVTDAITNWKEWITRKVEIKEGLISKVIEIKTELMEKAEIISRKIEENLLEFGNYLIRGKDWLLLKVKHSSSQPVGEILINFDAADGDIDLSEMIFDTDVNKKKSILYMPKWPKVVEEKILFIPK